MSDMSNTQSPREDRTEENVDMAATEPIEGLQQTPQEPTVQSELLWSDEDSLPLAALATPALGIPVLDIPTTQAQPMPEQPEEVAGPSGVQLTPAQIWNAAVEQTQLRAQQAVPPRRGAVSRGYTRWTRGMGNHYEHTVSRHFMSVIGFR